MKAHESVGHEKEYKGRVTDSSQSQMPAKLPIPENPIDTTVIDSLRILAEAPRSQSNRTNILTAKPQKINEKTERARKQKIANDNNEKDQKLKEDTLKKLFRFLTAETAVIFALAFIQGFRFRKFYLDEWSFRLITTATLGQITAMLTIAVRHLFPRNHSSH